MILYLLIYNRSGMDINVINLDRDVQKWKEIQAKFSESEGFVLHRISAVDGKTCGAACRQCSSRWYMTSGMTGCLESHRRLWKRCVEEGKPMLVFEDDCVPMDSINSAKITNAISALPQDYDFGVLGYLFDDRNWQMQITRPFLQARKAKPINAIWRVPAYFAGSHAYIVSARGAAKLLACKEVFHVDAMISRLKTLNLYAVNQCLFRQQQPGMIYIANTTLEWVLNEAVFGINDFPVRTGHLVLIVMMLCLLTTAHHITVRKLVVV